MAFALSSLRRRFLGCIVVTTVVFYAAVYVCVRHPQTVFPVESFFASPMSAAERAVLRRTVVALVDTLGRVNATYFMTSGTLIGSYRHHGIIPWDDDVDLIVRRADKRRLLDALRELEPDYSVFMHGYGQLETDRYHWKLYAADGRMVPFCRYRWPFVDVLFYDEDDSYVWNESPWFADERWPRSAVFPLVRRPFDDLWLPAPCDTETVLAINFAADQCVSRSYSHAYSVYIYSTVSVLCDVIRPFYPFVNRSSTTSSAATRRSDSGGRTPDDESGASAVVDESLVLDRKTLRTLTVRAGCR